MNKEFDLALSLGNNCKPTFYLKKFKLFSFAGPLDWMITDSLNSIAALFKENFATYFVNTKEINPENIKGSKKTHRYIRDIKNKVVSMHHFPLDIPIEKFKPRFLKLLKRRFEKMHRFIKMSESILFLSCRDETIEDFKIFLKEFANIYPGKKITLINIRHKADTRGIIEKFSLKNIEIIDYTADDIHPGDKTSENEYWTGNIVNWETILSNIRLSNKFIILRLVMKMKHVICKFLNSYDLLRYKFYKE